MLGAHWKNTRALGYLGEHLGTLKNTWDREKSREEKQTDRTVGLKLQGWGKELDTWGVYILLSYIYGDRT